MNIEDQHIQRPNFSRDQITTLDDFEAWLQWQLTQVELIGEINLTKSEWRKLGRLLGADLNKRSKSKIRQRILKDYPASFASFLVAQGVFGYIGGTYWPGVINQTSLKDSLIQGWGELFEEIIRRFRLTLFEDMPGLRFVSVILAHGGIPNYCLPDFFDKVLMQAITNPRYVDLSTEELIDAVMDRSQVQLFVDKPVQRFLEFGGKVAEDFFTRCVEMGESYVDTNEFPDAGEYGLPIRIGERFAEWASEQELIVVDRPRQDRLRLRKPQIHLDPWGDGMSIKLFSQEVPVKLLDKTFIWDIYHGPEKALHSQRNLRVRKIGLDYKIEERNVAFDIITDCIYIQLKFDNDVRRSWRFPVVKDEVPLLAFDSQSGSLITWRHSLPAESLWLLLPSTSSIEFTGEAQLKEEFPQIPGDWRSFRGSEWDLTGVTELSLTLDDGTVRSVPVRPSDALRRPSLIGEGTFFYNHDPEEVNIYTGPPPMLRLPLSGRQRPEEETQRWRIQLENKWASSPVIEKRFTPEIISEAIEINSDAIEIDLSDASMLGFMAWGTYQLTIRGPLGKDALFKFRLWPEIKLLDLKQIYLPGDVNGGKISFQMCVGSDANVIAQAGSGDLVVSPDETEQGTYDLLVDPNLQIAAVLLVKDQEEGMQIQVPLYIPIPLLRWSLIDQMEYDLDPAMKIDPILVTLDKVLQVENTPWLRILLPIDGDEDVRFRLQLIDIGDELLQEGCEYRARKGWHAYRIPLAEFKDTLRSKKSAAYKVELEIEGLGDAEIPTKIHLLTLREPILGKCISIEDSADEWVIRWEDVKQVPNKELRLTPLWRPWESTHVIQIPNDAMEEMRIQKTSSDIQTGRYIVDIAAIDPWVIQKSLHHCDKESPSAELIDIGSPETRRERLVEVIRVNSRAFDAYFEAACLLFDLGSSDQASRGLHWCVNQIQLADVKHILALHDYLRERGYENFLNDLKIQMYHKRQIELIRDLWLGDNIQPEQLDAYIDAAPHPNLISADTARVLKSLGHQASDLKAIQSLMLHDDPEGVGTILSCVEGQVLSDRDAIELLVINGDLAVNELSNCPENPFALRLLEGLIPRLGDDVPLIRAGSWVRTNAGWGKIHAIHDSYLGESIERFIQGTIKPTLHAVLREGETNERIIIYLREGYLEFLDEGEIWTCTKCHEFSTINRDVIFSRHNSSVHGGQNTELHPEKSNRLIIRSVRYSFRRPNDIWS